MSDSESSLSSLPASEDEKLAPIFLKARGTKKQTPKPKPNPKPTSTSTSTSTLTSTSKSKSKSKSKAQPQKKATKLHNDNVPAPEPASPPRPKRSPSPAHEEVLADNPDVAFLVMFRSRFSGAFPSKLAHYGPQDIERGVVDSVPSPQVENLLCAILGLVLNRKKPVERGHHARALEEAISTNKHQWPKSWNATNPLPGSKTFNDLAPAERLNLLRTLVIWSLTSSDEISKTIKDSYKQSRHEDDLNQPLSVQPWGADDDKRRYWLIEGQDDTSFRLYREGNRALKNVTWRSMAGTIDEVKDVCATLDRKHTTQAARRLTARITSAIPRFEATEEKRRRREYRQVRRAQFARPEPGFSLYEGRTRGKRARYNYDENDDEDTNFDSDALSTARRSTRNSNQSTPAETGPVVTASGRTVRPRGGGVYGESLLSGGAAIATPTGPDSYAASEMDDELAGDQPALGRAAKASRRSDVDGASNLSGTRKRKHTETYNELSDESDVESGNDWEGGDDYDEQGNPDEEESEDDMSVDAEENDDDLDDVTSKKSLVVKLKLGSELKDVSSAPDVPTTIKSSQDLHEMDTKPSHVGDEDEKSATTGAPSSSDSIVVAKTEDSTKKTDPLAPAILAATKPSTPYQALETKPDVEDLDHPPPAPASPSNANTTIDTKIAGPLSPHHASSKPFHGHVELPSGFSTTQQAQQPQAQQVHANGWN